ncbi:MAG: MFS transporter, partial [Acidimicrobiales bacterium]
MVARLSVDLAPLRQSRDLRLLYAGRAISSVGNAVTAVAAALQVYDLTHSSLAVGAISAAEAVPMVAAMLVGGALADAFDRRRLILFPQLIAGVLLAGLAANAALPHPRLWLVYLLVATSGAALGVGAPARSAAVPTLVAPELLPAAVALNSTVNKLASLVGPALGGLIVARFGLTAAFGADAVCFGAYAVVVAFVGPLPPSTRTTRPGARSFAEGLTYVRHHGLVIGLLLIDVDAMVFGMPKALFPAIGTVTFHGGPATVGLLYAAPAAGALAAAATSGWISAVRRAGPVLLASVMV